MSAYLCPTVSSCSSDNVRLSLSHCVFMSLTQCLPISVPLCLRVPLTMSAYLCPTVSSCPSHNVRLSLLSAYLCLTVSSCSSDNVCLSLFHSVFMSFTQCPPIHVTVSASVFLYKYSLCRLLLSFYKSVTSGLLIFVSLSIDVFQLLSLICLPTSVSVAVCLSMSVSLSFFLSLCPFF